VYAWWQPFSWLKLTIGDIDGNVWGTPGAYDTGIDEKVGLRVEFPELVKGLSFGVAYGLSDWTTLIPNSA
jgi:hypothetical protein